MKIIKKIIKRRSNKNKLIISIIVGFILITGLAASAYGLLVNNNSQANEKEIIEKSVPVTVQTTRVQRQDTGNYISLSGITEPLDEVLVSPKMSGKVVGIYVEEGGQVKIGQTIMQLEQDAILMTSYNNAQANLTNTIAATNQDINTAEVSVATVETNLFNTRISTEDSVRNAELAVEAARIALEAAEKSQANIGVSNEQAIENAYDSLKTTMQGNLTMVKSALTAVGDIVGESPGDKTANDDYEQVLGVKNLSSESAARSAFFQAKDKYDLVYANFNNLESVAPYAAVDTAGTDVKSAQDLMKQTLEKTRIMLDNTITTADFSLASLNALKTTVDSHLAVINLAIPALQAREQAVTGAKLTDTSSGDTVQSAYDAAQTNLERAEQALALTQSQVKTQLDMTTKQLESAKENLKGVKRRATMQVTAARGQLDSIKAQISNTAITAPIAGTLNQIFIESGEMAVAGKPIATIVNTAGIKIELVLTEFDIAKVAEDQEAKVTMASYGEEEFMGVVYYASLVANPVSRKFPVKIQLGNQDGRIKAGLVAEVNIIIQKRENILVIPATAVFTADGEEKVYIIDNEKRINIKTINTEAVNDNETAVISGLSEGEEVVVNGNYDLKAGDIVVVSPK